MDRSVPSPLWRADCESLALEVREDLKLAAGARLDPGALAAFLGIPTLSLDSFGAAEPDAVRQLRSEDERFSFSAATVTVGTRRVIVYHPDHPRARHVNSVAHEVAHVLLDHEPAVLPLYDEEGTRLSVSPEEEWEADYLAGALLAPRCMVAAVLGRFAQDLTRGAAHFGVGERLMAARLCASEGVDRWAARELSVLLRMSEEEMVMMRRARRGPVGY